MAHLRADTKRREQALARALQGLNEVEALLTTAWERESRLEQAAAKAKAETRTRLEARFPSLTGRLMSTNGTEPSGASWTTEDLP